MVSKRSFATLKRSSDFAKLKEQGQRVRPCSWLILSFMLRDPIENEANLRCGWTISRRVGNAVIRNRLKRWCRQFFREARSPLPVGLDLNVILLQQPPGFFKELEQDEFFSALQRGCRGVFKRLEMDAANERRSLS